MRLIRRLAALLRLWSSPCNCLLNFGGRTRTRTLDPLIKRQKSNASAPAPNFSTLPHLSQKCPYSRGFHNSYCFLSIPNIYLIHAYPLLTLGPLTIRLATFPQALGKQIEGFHADKTHSCVLSKGDGGERRADNLLGFRTAWLRLGCDEERPPFFRRAVSRGSHEEEPPDENRRRARARRR